MDTTKEIDIAYKNAIQFTRSHYENFPVISFLIPKHLRKHVAIVYQFARQADDIADEGNASTDERLAQLEDYELNLRESSNNNVINCFWKALHFTIEEKQLDIIDFANLLKAFKQDLKIKRYQNYSELLNYCSNSANPVGRIILGLNGINNRDVIEASDKICTALQLTNFLQDVSIDFLKDRIYLPKDEMDKYSVTENSIGLKLVDNSFTELMKFQVERIKALFSEGKSILRFLPFGLRQQIRWTINGGIGILEKIEKIEFDVLNSRPKFSKSDILILLFKR